MVSGQPADEPFSRIDSSAWVAPVEARLLLLEPPYRSSRSFHSREPALIPLGSVVCATDPNLLASLSSLIVALNVCPWALPTIAVSLTDRRYFQPLVNSIPALEGRIACVSLDATNAAPASSELIRAIRDRPRPTAWAMARYVSSRLATRNIGRALERQFSGALRGARAPMDRSVASYCRLFRKYGTLTPKDWRALARLAAQCCRGVVQLTAHDRSRLTRYTYRYLDKGLMEASALLGWETVLEEGLRHAGYRLFQIARRGTTGEQTGVSLAL